MKKYNLLAVISLNLIMLSCGDENKTHFAFDETKIEAHYTNSESAALTILNADNKEIDSVAYFVNDKRVAGAKDLKPVNLPLAGYKLGYQEVLAKIYFGGKTEEITSRVEVVSSITPKLLTYKVLNTYPHDISSFTEGLEFYRDTLLEGTGQYGSSKLLKVDYKTGKILKSADLQSQYFGEGITVINGKIYQLTYKEKTGFIYNADTWKIEKTFTFDKDIEGWGMTHDNQYIYQTDGTEKIWKMDPSTQKMVDYISVYSSSDKIKSLNELELIDGEMYGNIWQKDLIAIINPATGEVTAAIDLSELRKSLTNPEAEVLNGIAYNPKTKTIFVTGKNWDKIFEISVLK
ncbi:glutamine cyclotransferase [Flavobacterium magnum]|uniref:Glutamine cyclotransferase n=1 Tax=Flavobacterium magnum TaxID=2162713 RepID=A0A2S0RGW1_9FLAO|nr:glutaminyl-peptide cyclotransferase [Flavobacterium magnum]AWA30904.1 glutamine cyclotransferase [Flavobacterium magnum]